MQVLLIFSLIVAVVAVLFAVQNADPTPVRFLFWKYDSPLAVTLLLAVLLGVLMSILFSLPSMTRSKLMIRNQRKKMTELENGLNDTKSQLVNSQLKVTELENALAEAKKPPAAEVEADSNSAKLE